MVHRHGHNIVSRVLGVLLLAGLAFVVFQGCAGRNPVGQAGKYNKQPWEYTAKENERMALKDSGPAGCGTAAKKVCTAVSNGPPFCTCAPLDCEKCKGVVGVACAKQVEITKLAIANTRDLNCREIPVYQDAFWDEATCRSTFNNMLDNQNRAEQECITNAAKSCPC